MPDIELKKIQPNRLNPRLEFGKAGLDELADSISQVGLLEPVIVRPRGRDSYEVVVGERRYRAAQQAGLERIPVIIRDYADEEVLEINLVENVQREDLSAVEKGRVCKQLMERFPDKYPKQEMLARRLGVNRATMAHWIQTTELPEPIQKMIAPEMRPIGGRPPDSKTVDYETALRVTRQVKEPEKAIELIKQIAERRIPVRQAVEVARQVAKNPANSVKDVIRKVVEEAPIFLPFSAVHAEAILKKLKAQTSRKAKDPRLKKGVTVRAQVTHFADLEVIDVYRKRLGDFDDEDAKREGGYTLDEFKRVWKALHGEWNPNESVYIIRFRLARVVGEPNNDSG